MEKEEIVPYDEMDPCCQKEYDMQKKEKEIRSKLRAVDLSYSKEDTMKSVFKFTNNNNHYCECCTDSVDYSSLRVFRNRQEEINNNEDNEINQTEDDRIHSDDSDDDSLEDLDFLTPYEQERLAQVAEAENKLKALQLQGYGSHLEDSIEHILQDIHAGNNYVLHVYDNNELCAKIDYALEEFSKKFYGTKFRRVHRAVAIGELEKIVGAIIDQSCILLFMRNSFVTNILDSVHNQLYHYQDINRELLKYLSNTNVLTTELPQLALRGNLNDSDNENENDVELRSYCDVIGCSKQFYHEHINNNATTDSTPTFLNLDKDEVFAKNALQTI